jgi:hypothetical protein
LEPPRLATTNKTLTGSGSLPPELLEIPGLIGDVMRQNLATAHFPLPELAPGRRWL